jgi:hypothetical protein
MTMTAGRIFDDLFGKQIVQFSMPTSMFGAPMAGYYRNTPYVLPAPVTNDLTAPALPPIAVSAVGPAVVAGSSQLARAKLAGLGWNPRFLSRLAA